MQVFFASRELEKRLGTEKARRRAFGDEVGRRIYRRLVEIESAPNLDALKTLPGRCHELSENRQGQLAIDVTRNLRLVFEPADEPKPVREDGGLDWRRVNAVRIREVVDYHD